MTDTADIFTTVRDFSAAGPCVTLGTVVRETPLAITFVEPSGKFRRLNKSSHRFQSGLTHLAACPSCRDHAHSHYPNGYED